MHAYMVKLHGKFRILGIYLLLEYWDGEGRIEKTATETKVLGLKFQKTEQRTSNFQKNRISGTVDCDKIGRRPPPWLFCPGIF